MKKWYIVDSIKRIPYSSASYTVKKAVSASTYRRSYYDAPTTVVEAETAEEALKAYEAMQTRKALQREEALVEAQVGTAPPRWLTVAQSLYPNGDTEEIARILWQSALRGGIVASEDPLTREHVRRAVIAHLRHNATDYDAASINPAHRGFDRSSYNASLDYLLEQILG